MECTGRSRFSRFFNSKADLLYTYAPNGNLLIKKVDTAESTIYVCDSQGNVLHVYEVNRGSFPLQYNQNELYMYVSRPSSGCSRLGLSRKNALVRIDSSGIGINQYSSLSVMIKFAFEIGNKSYVSYPYQGSSNSSINDLIGRTRKNYIR